MRSRSKPLHDCDPATLTTAECARYTAKILSDLRGIAASAQRHQLAHLLDLAEREAFWESRR